MERIVSVSCAGGVLVLLGCLTAATSWLTRATAVTMFRLWNTATPAFDDLVVLVALGILTPAACWLTLGLTLTAAAELLRCTQGILGRLAEKVTPRVGRVLVRALCSAIVVSAPGALSAGATPVEPSQSSAAGCVARRCADVLHGLPAPDRVSGLPAQSGAARVTVRPGDTLWAIAARHLHSAGEPEIAAAWPVWFRVNRGRLGPEPDLIHPRTRLLVPQRFRPDDKDLR